MIGLRYLSPCGYTLVWGVDIHLNEVIGVPRAGRGTIDQVIDTGWPQPWSQITSYLEARSLAPSGCSHRAITIHPPVCNNTPCNLRLCIAGRGCGDRWVVGRWDNFGVIIHANLASALSKHSILWYCFFAPSFGEADLPTFIPTDKPSEKLQLAGKKLYHSESTKMLKVNVQLT